MAKSASGMSDAEAMHELAKLLWERYFKARASEELLSHSLDGYKASVTANNGDGTLTVQRPFDDTLMTLKCPPALAQSAETGDQVLIVQLGDASNSFILCGADLTGFGGGEPAENISYDPTGTDLDSDNVQDAITELADTRTPMWFGTRQEYNSLPSIDPDVCYCIEEGT